MVKPSRCSQKMMAGRFKIGELVQLDPFYFDLSVEQLPGIGLVIESVGNINDISIMYDWCITTSILGDVNAKKLDQIFQKFEAENVLEANSSAAVNLLWAGKYKTEYSRYLKILNDG